MSIAGSPNSAATRFDCLDALRGISALMVALYHFNSNGYIAQLPFVQNGWLFVDYFFVLSGFVIAHSYGDRLAQRKISISRFMGLRMGRIYPLHIAVLLAFVALELVLWLAGDAISQLATRDPFTGARQPESLLQSVLLIQTFGLPRAWGWNIPAWSIAAEMWTYLLFALVFVVGRRWLVAISLTLALGCAAAIMSYAPDLHVTYDGGLLRCIFGFGLGVATFHAFQRFGGRGGTGPEVLAAMLAVLFVSFASGAATFLAPFVFAGTIFIMAAQQGAISRALSRRPFLFLGTISYSVYMVHMFLQGRFAELLKLSGLADVSFGERGQMQLSGSPMTGDILTLAMLTALIATSYISYRLVEQPGRDLSRKLLRGHRSGDKTEQPVSQQS